MTYRSKWTGNDLFFPVLLILATLKVALVRRLALGEINPLPALPLEMAFIFIILATVDLIPSRHSRFATLGAYTVLSLLLTALAVYIGFYAQLFDPRILSVAGQLATVGGAVGGLIKPIHVALLVDIPFLAWWAVILGRTDLASASAPVPPDDGFDRRPRRSERHPRTTGRNRWVAVVLSVCLVAFGVQMLSAVQIPADVDGVAIARLRGLSVAQLAVLLPRGAEDVVNAGTDRPQLAPVPAGVPTATPAAVSALPTIPVTAGSTLQERIEQIRGAENGSRIATFSPGAYAGMNVIVIQLEALNTMVMQKKIAGVEITPNLNALINESWYFPNTYAQTGLGNTADAEFVVNTSLYPPRTQAAPVAYVDRTIPSLPRLLGQQGYDTFTAHANTVRYWNRKELYAALGFSRYYEREFFGTKDMLNANGASDEVLYRKSAELLRQVDATATPFYAQVISLSAHTPFDLVPPGRRPMKTPAGLQGSLIGDYISSQSYSDFAVGQFIVQLKADKVWDDSIVIIYGDHTSMNENKLSGKDERGAKKLLGRSYSAADRQRVPLIIHLPGQSRAEVVTATVGQVDIMPTIADLLGVDLRSTPHMGRSVFVASNALVPMRSYLPGGTFANDRVVFLPGVGYKDGSAFGIESGEGADKTEREREDLERVRQLSKLSESWILSQPKRSGVRELREYWIPNHAARPKQ